MGLGLLSREELTGIRGSLRDITVNDYVSLLIILFINLEMFLVTKRDISFACCVLKRVACLRFIHWAFYFFLSFLFLCYYTFLPSANVRMEQYVLM